MTEERTNLTQEQIRKLALVLCNDDPEKAGVLLVLVTDMNNRQSASPRESFPFYAVRQVAYSQLGNDAIDAQADMLRSELLGTQKGGDA